MFEHTTTVLKEAATREVHALRGVEERLVGRKRGSVGLSATSGARDA